MPTGPKPTNRLALVAAVAEPNGNSHHRVPKLAAERREKLLASFNGRPKESAACAHWSGNGENLRSALLEGRRAGETGEEGPVPLRR
jgi:hypothetical protein